MEKRSIALTETRALRTSVFHPVHIDTMVSIENGWSSAINSYAAWFRLKWEKIDRFKEKILELDRLSNFLPVFVSFERIYLKKGIDWWKIFNIGGGRHWSLLTKCFLNKRFHRMIVAKLSFKEARIERLAKQNSPNEWIFSHRSPNFITSQPPISARREPNDRYTRSRLR